MTDDELTAVVARLVRVNDDDLDGFPTAELTAEVTALVTTEPSTAREGLTSSPIPSRLEYDEHLDALDPVGDDAMVVDLETVRRERSGGRWRLIAAAALAAVVVLAGTALATGAMYRAIITPSQTPATPTAPRTPLTPPSTTPRDASTTSPLLPEGVPSTPPTGELVATIGIRHRGAYRLYADGRLISTLFDDPAYQQAYPLSSPWTAQRLTPEGVERVRSRFLSSGLFDSAQPLSDVNCPPVHACVRDGDRWLGVQVDVLGASQSQAPPDAVRLFDDLGGLASTLPATEWIDPQREPYVSARIATCVKTVEIPDPSLAVGFEVPLDLSVLLPRLSAPVATLLTGREPNADLMSRMLPSLEGRIGHGGCFELTLDEARTLVDTALSPTGGGTHAYGGLVLRLTPKSDPADATQPDRAWIWFEQLLPDGVPTTTGD